MTLGYINEPLLLTATAHNRNIHMKYQCPAFSKITKATPRFYLTLIEESYLSKLKTYGFRLYKRTLRTLIVDCNCSQ